MRTRTDVSAKTDVSFIHGLKVLARGSGCLRDKVIHQPSAPTWPDE